MKKILFLLCFCFSSFILKAQEEIKKSETEKALQLSEKYSFEAFQLTQKNEKIKAEAEYRKALSYQEQNTQANYNISHLLQQKKSFREAKPFLIEASVSKGATKEQKHKIFHNLGNLAMKEKNYQEAVQAYKEALRNNPNDEETRYNFALAKEMLKQNPPEPENQDKNNQGNDKNNQGQDQNQKENDKNNQEKDQDQKENNQNQKENDKNNQEKDQNQNKNNENQDKNDQNNQEKDKNNQGDGQGRQENDPSRLGQKQSERILEAINNQEKKTQEKINAKREKGMPVRNQKDW